VHNSPMASINQYRGKTWRAIIRRKGFPVQSKTFTSKKDAEAWAASVESRMGVGNFDALQLKTARATTVKDLFDRYDREVGPGMKGRNSRGIVTRLIRDAAFMPLVVSKVTAQDIRQWRDDRVKEIQPQSVHRELNTISGVFTHAIKEWGVALEANPCHAVSRFKGADKFRDKLWGAEDSAKLLKSLKWSETMPLKSGRDYVGFAFLICVETAMRIGELCAATVGNFHPDGKYLHLPDTKNGDQRNVPLSTAALRLLSILCAGKKPGDKIVPVNANTFSEYFLDARRACGLEYLVFHDSRHTAATQLSTKLSNVLELSAVTGHRSLKALKRYYHPTPADIAGKLG
jgi:integrase